MSEFETQVAKLLLADTTEEREEAKEVLRSLMESGAQPPQQKRDLEAEVRRVLLELGVPDKPRGHRYLVKALCIAVEEPEIIDAITKGLYPAVAAECNTTAGRVERAIRHAIECGWDRGDLEVMQHYFGNTVSISKSKPTNSEFIARVANVIRERMAK